MDIGRDDIDQWHRARGWKCIGYHFVIRRDGTIERGRGIDEIGAHVKGHNKDSIGVCLAGGRGSKPNDTPLAHYTMTQMQSLRKLITALELILGHMTLHGHNEYAAKACPGFNVREHLNA